MASAQIPPQLGEELSKTFDLDTLPTTTGEFAAAIPTKLMNDINELCTSAPSRHAIHLDSESYYVHCTLDTLVLPFLLDTSSTFEIASESPISGETVKVHGSLDAIDVVPEKAVMSFGVRKINKNSGESDITPEFVYRQFCPYTNAFLSKAEYKRWAVETKEATSMSLAFDEAFSLAQALIAHSAPDSIQ
jgi:hypothetical protein